MIPGLFDLTYVPNATQQQNDYMVLGDAESISPVVLLVKQADGLAATDEVRIGGVNATGNNNSVVIQSALTDFMGALNTAITALGANPASAALMALRTALNALHAGGGWDANTVVAKAM